jgi:hypothetical protein
VVATKPRKATAEARFRSAEELREILDAMMAAVDADPEAGPRLRAGAAPLRFDFPDLHLALNVRKAARGLEWDFAPRASTTPKLRLRMDSAVANRVLQGRENPAIAIARGRLKTKVGDAGAALCFFGTAKPLFARYREIVVEQYPHLAIG